MSDPRFARFKTDPRFRPLKKHKSKVVIDERFKSVFDKGKSTKKGRVDKYGRPITQNHDRDALHRFYRLENQDGNQSDNDDEKLSAPDYARGQVLLESSDEDEDEDEEDQGPVTFGRESIQSPHLLHEEAEIDLDENTFADLDAQAAAYSKQHAEDNQNAAEATEKTRRIAVVNLDWDHVRAIHLYKIFSSLLSSTAHLPVRKSQGSHISLGKVLHVKIYPSQFGKERMAREEKEGPPPELFKHRQATNENEVDEKNIYKVGDGDEYDEDALRKYQLDRLRYFYAIATCDTVEAASQIFSELEGAELERSANVFDLSFVSDDMSFDDEPRDEADESSIANYKGLDFSTDALRHSKVKLTWDEDDQERHQVTRRALTKKEIEEDDFRAYIASSSDDNNDDVEDPTPSKGAKRTQARDRLRSLLLDNKNDDLPEGWGNDNDNTDDIDMQITFTSGLNKSEDHDETTLEKYQRKLREKRKQRKEHTEQSTEDQAEDGALQDDFFAIDSDTETKSSRKKGKEGSGAQQITRPSATKEELALLAAGDDANSEAKHFDFSAVIKAEKMSKGKRKKAKKGGLDTDEIQEDFVIDVADDRFKAIHEDHSYAIDPSNPSYKKTKAMTALLAQRLSHQKTGRPTAENPSPLVSDNRSLERLVENVRRKSESSRHQLERKGKRPRLT